jgi:hypothetical protein
LLQDQQSLTGRENVGKIIKMFMDLKIEADGCRSTKAVKFVPP